MTMTFDTPRTKALAALIAREGPDGTGRIVGLSIEGADGVFIYTRSALWCDDSGAGTFHGSSESAAVAAFRERVQPGNGCTSYPAPAAFGPCGCEACNAPTIRDTETGLPRDENAPALALHEQYATVWGRNAEDARALATVSAPRVIGDTGGGFFRLADTDGRTLKAWTRRPRVADVRAALDTVDNARREIEERAADMTDSDIEESRALYARDAEETEERARARRDRENGRALLHNLAALARIRADALAAVAEARAAAPLRFRMVPTVDGGTTLQRTYRAHALAAEAGAAHDLAAAVADVTGDHADRARAGDREAAAVAAEDAAARAALADREAAVKAERWTAREAGDAARLAACEAAESGDTDAAAASFLKAAESYDAADMPGRARDCRAHAAALADREAAAHDARQVPVPSYLNGRPVVRVRDHGNGYFSVMTTGEPGTGESPYCVATWGDGCGTGWTWGHYATTAEEAESDWREVTDRNARRSPVRARSVGAAAVFPGVAEGEGDAFRNRDGSRARTAPRGLSRAALAAAMAADGLALAPVPRAVYTAARVADRVARGVETWERVGVEKVARAIESAVDLYADPADPFESVRDFVGYPEARETLAWAAPGGRAHLTPAGAAWASESPEEAADAFRALARQ